MAQRTREALEFNIFMILHDNFQRSWCRQQCGARAVLDVDGRPCDLEQQVAHHVSGGSLHRVDDEGLAMTMALMEAVGGFQHERMRFGE